MSWPGGLLLGMGNELGEGREGRREESWEQRLPHGLCLIWHEPFGQGRAC